MAQHPLSLLCIFLLIAVVHSLDPAAGTLSQSSIFDIDLTGVPSFIKLMSRTALLENTKRSTGFPIKVKNLRIDDCGSKDYKLEHYKLTPDMKLSGSVHVLEEICSAGDDITVDVTISKKMSSFFNFFTKMPCVDGKFGSCSVQNICDKAPKRCPQAIKDLGLPCGFPIPVGEYSVNDLQIPAPPSGARIPVPAWIIKGDFKTQVIVRKSGARIGCHTASFSLA
jgi:hypothetical protein